MGKKLFRKEALETIGQRLQGDVLLLPKMSHSIVILGLLIWIMAVVIWLTTSSYARKERVYGWLEPTAGVVELYPNIADRNIGLVRQVFVREGDIVREGQPLVSISEGRSLPSGKNLENQMLDEHALQRKIINQKIARNQQIFEETKQKVKDRLYFIEEQLVIAKKKISLAEERYEILVKKKNRVQKLSDAGNASFSSLEDSISDELEMLSETQVIKSEINDLLLSKRELDIELQLIQKNHKNDLDNFALELSGIRLAEVRLQGEREYVVRATRTGKVSALEVNVGSRPQQNVPLLSIIPLDGNLVAHLLVPVRSIAFVEPGQTVFFYYDAFPYQQFGVYEGEILNITSSVILPTHLIDTPVTSSMPVYLVTASISKSEIQAYGRDLPLKSGMTLSADIKLAERTLGQWFIEPILRFKGQL